MKEKILSTRIPIEYIFPPRFIGLTSTRVGSGGVLWIGVETSITYLRESSMWFILRSKLHSFILSPIVTRCSWIRRSTILLMLRGMMRDVMVWLAKLLSNKSCDIEDVGHSTYGSSEVWFGRKYFKWIQIYYNRLMTHTY